MSRNETPMKRYQVHVTVECTCVIEVEAENQYDAVDGAKERYVREDLDVDPPHAADWRNAEVIEVKS